MNRDRHERARRLNTDTGLGFGFIGGEGTRGLDSTRWGLSCETRRSDVWARAIHVGHRTWVRMSVAGGDRVPFRSG